jgi:hypothetical protein
MQTHTKKRFILSDKVTDTEIETDHPNYFYRLKISIIDQHKHAVKCIKYTPANLISSEIELESQEPHLVDFYMSRIIQKGQLGLLEDFENFEIALSALDGDSI